MLDFISHITNIMRFSAYWVIDASQAVKFTSTNEKEEQKLLFFNFTFD